MMGKFGLKYVCQQHISPIVYQYKLMAKMLSTLCTVVTMPSLLTPGLHWSMVYTPPTSCQAPAGAATSLLCWWPATAGCVQPSVSEHQLSVGTTGQCSARARRWSDVSGRCRRYSHPATALRPRRHHQPSARHSETLRWPQCLLLLSGHNQWQLKTPQKETDGWRQSRLFFSCLPLLKLVVCTVICNLVRGGIKTMQCTESVKEGLRFKNINPGTPVHVLLWLWALQCVNDIVKVNISCWWAEEDILNTRT